MENRPFISIVIPVHNAEAHLRECLDSIVTQDIGDMAEIILVDDGSTDSSPAICDEYAANDKRIRVMRNEGGGASGAGNMGARIARGEYLLFIDADDYIYEGSLLKIITRAKADPFDVVFLSADKALANGTVKTRLCRYDRTMLYKKSRSKVLAYINKLSRLPIPPCIKLLRRDFVVQNELFFQEGIVCEEVDHTYKILLAAETFDYYDFPYYAARPKRQGPNDSSNASRRFDSTHFIINKWIVYANENPAHSDIVFGFLAIQYTYLAAMLGDIPADRRAGHETTVTTLSWLLNYGGSGKFAIIRLLFRITTLRFFCAVMRKILL